MAIVILALSVVCVWSLLQLRELKIEIKNADSLWRDEIKAHEAHLLAKMWRCNCCGELLPDAVPAVSRSDRETGDVFYTCVGCEPGVEPLELAVPDSDPVVQVDELPEPNDAEVEAVLAGVARLTADDDEEIYDCVSCGGCSVGSPDEMCSFCSLGVAGTPNPREDTREYLERALI